MVVSVPAGAQVDDWALLAFEHDATAPTTTWPSGFVQLANDLVCTADGGRSGCAWKRLTSGDISGGTFTVTASSGTQNWTLGCGLWSGRDTSGSPVAVTTDQDTPQSAPSVSIISGDITASLGDDIAFWSAPDTGSNTVWVGHAPPTNYTEALDFTNGWASLALFYRDNVAAGATGALTSTFSISGHSSGYGTWLVRMPAAGVADDFTLAVDHAPAVAEPSVITLTTSTAFVLAVTHSDIAGQGNQLPFIITNVANDGSAVFEASDVNIIAANSFSLPVTYGPVVFAGQSVALLALDNFTLPVTYGPVVFAGQDVALVVPYATSSRKTKYRRIIRLIRGTR
jgi:hypothetical protein